MLRGLVHETADGPQVRNAYTATDTGPAGVTSYSGQPVSQTASGGAGGQSGVGTQTSVAAAGADAAVGAGVDSHLDSFFQRSALTREDVLVVAAVVQMAAWAALLYLEVTE